MKEVLLIRHAKSSWEYPHLPDLERPLNQRGLRDAPFMASFLRSQTIIPSNIISSPAARAWTTAEYFASEFDIAEDRIWKETELYFGSEEDWLDCIHNLDEEVSLPAFFSHNPLLTYFANRFTDDWIDNVPTCGIVCIKSTAEEWSEFYFDNAAVDKLFFPKRVRKYYEGN